ncbi:MAG: DUF2157 domain-containing protein [Actinomycetota bacterium]|nr:DUF2157 domain-containing protein [Actinomycetota bacterium]
MTLERRFDRDAAGGARVADELRRWVDAGLVSEDQARAIAAFERGPSTPTVAETVGAAASGETAEGRGTGRRVPPVAEALGYLGGVLAMVGLASLLVRYWPDMALAGRVGLAGLGAVLSGIGGALVAQRSDPALDRLRGFLWVLSSAASALVAGVVAADGFDASVAMVVAVGGATAAVHGGLLWAWREDRPMQQLTALVAVAVAAGGFVATGAESAAGLAVWSVGAVYLLAGLARRTPRPLLTEIVGSAALVVGSIMTVANWLGWGGLFGVATGFVLLGVAAAPSAPTSRNDDILLVVTGGIAVSQFAPATLGYWAADAGLATGLIMWAVGAALIVAGSRRLVRAPTVVAGVGGLVLFGGAAITAAQSVGFAPLFGTASAVALIALGMLPGRVLLSVIGSLGLLVNVPWAIVVHFPGEGRAPLLIMVTGVLIAAVAVLLARAGPRVHADLHSRDGRAAPPSAPA